MASRRSFFRSLGTRGILALLGFIGIFGAAEAAAAQLIATWDDNSGGLARTQVERRLATASVFSVVADLPPGQTSYVDTTVLDATAYCYRVLAYNASGASPYSAVVSATPPGTALSVTVGKTGPGTGTVSSSPAGINCGSTCAATYSAGTSVTLSATPAPTSTFGGWGGSTCS